MDRVDILVTDSGLPERGLKTLREHIERVLIADPPT